MSVKFRIQPKEITAPVLIIGGLGILLIAFMLFFHKPTLQLTPTLTGKPERCLTCHNGIEPISASHPIQEFGCVSCHDGDGMALDEDGAHTGLVRNPASLDVVQQYCGDCHAAQISLVQHSTMATYAGAIGLVRRAFGMQPDGTAQYAVHAVGDLLAFLPHPSDPQPVQDFAANCQNCHLYAEPQQVDYYHRSTGCSSCHVLYNEEGLYQGGDPIYPKRCSGIPPTAYFYNRYSLYAM